MITPKITLTETALTYLKTKVANTQGAGIRLSIKKTGCSGYSYVPEVVTDIQPNDIRVEVAPDLFIWIDTAWVDLLQTIHIDYVEDLSSGLKQRRLVFSNPLESGRCGCGESFHLKS